MGLFDIFTGGGGSKIKMPDFSQTNQFIGDLSSKYSESPTDIDATGQKQLEQINGIKSTQKERALSDIGSNTATSQNISKMLGGDSLAQSNLNRIKQTDSAAAFGNINNKFSVMEDLLKEKNIGEGIRRYKDVNTNILPSMWQGQSDIKNRIAEANAQANAQENAGAAGLGGMLGTAAGFALGGGPMGGAVGGTIGSKLFS